MEEYRSLKSRYSFLQLCKTPELAVEVTLQPLKAFDMDAAILFSDILLPCEALGIEIAFNPGPQIINPVRTASDADSLRIQTLEQTAAPVYAALQRLSTECSAIGKALIGFAGAPWTLASYLIDQRSYKHFEGALIFARRNPQAMHRLLRTLSELIALYLCGQASSGAQALQLFDTWAGNLNEADYREFALPYNAQIIERVSATGVPVILYNNNCAHLLRALEDTGADCLSIDSRTSLESAQRLLAPDTAVQGNLDPSALFAPPEQIRERTLKMLRSWTSPAGFVANLGHGVLQETPRDGVAAFVDTVKSFRLQSTHP